ncbi:MAG: 2-oxo-4-hydroxy-4-carboxy-5-ureidoimidazoline decarboxylase [Granulosicoccus sp.]
MKKINSFKERPSSMNELRFIEIFGGVYEHSAWVASRTFQLGFTEQQDTVAGLSKAMADTLLEASYDEKLALIRAHPDLAGREALAGSLTTESASEQNSAGLSSCTADEVTHFQALNCEYRNKHGFPFVLAVRNRNRQQIRECFEARIKNDTEEEFIAALREINKIAVLRLHDIAAGE